MRRTPQGVRGLKYLRYIKIDFVTRRTPQGVRGLKLAVHGANRLLSSRTPQGVRGLKSHTAGAKRGARLSHPARGAWIEMGQPAASD